jgi:hypothetical protein
VTNSGCPRSNAEVRRPTGFGGRTFPRCCGTGGVSLAELEDQSQAGMCCDQPVGAGVPAVSGVVGAAE